MRKTGRKGQKSRMKRSPWRWEKRVSSRLLSAEEGDENAGSDAVKIMRR